MRYDFDTPVDQKKLTSMKWEPRYREGKDVLCFSLADSDFQAPPVLTKRLVERAQKPHYGYTYRPDSVGRAVSGWYGRHTGWKMAPGWIMKGYGIYPSICLIIQEFTEPGQGVIFQTPVHEVFWTVVRANGRTPVENPLVLEGDRYAVDFDDFERKIVANDVTMYILCNPHNPVCQAWDKKTLRRLADICLKHGVLMVSDEVYAPLVHPGHRHVPLASLSKKASMSTITCFSPSKAFSLTGIKDSLTIMENREFRHRYEAALVTMNMNFGANLFGNVAIQCTLDECDDWLEQQVEYVLENRRMMEEFLGKKAPALKLMPANATCFAWLDCRGLGLPDAKLENFFTDKAKVLVRPGHYMGPGGAGFIRMVLACPRKTLLQGLKRIAKAL